MACLYLKPPDQGCLSNIVFDLRRRNLSLLPEENRIDAQDLDCAEGFLQKWGTSVESQFVAAPDTLEGFIKIVGAYQDLHDTSVAVWGRLRQLRKAIKEGASGLAQEQVTEPPILTDIPDDAEKRANNQSAYRLYQYYLQSGLFGKGLVAPRPFPFDVFESVKWSKGCVMERFGIIEKKAFFPGRWVELKLHGTMKFGYQRFIKNVTPDCKLVCTHYSNRSDHPRFFHEVIIEDESTELRFAAEKYLNMRKIQAELQTRQKLGKEELELIKAVLLDVAFHLRRRSTPIFLGAIAREMIDSLLKIRENREYYLYLERIHQGRFGKLPEFMMPEQFFNKRDTNNAQDRFEIVEQRGLWVGTDAMLCDPITNDTRQVTIRSILPAVFLGVNDSNVFYQPQHFTPLTFAHL